jgi:hypothetical protein
MRLIFLLESNQILGVSTAQRRQVDRLGVNTSDEILPQNEQPTAVSVLTSYFSLHRTPPTSGYSPRCGSGTAASRIDSPDR